MNKTVRIQLGEETRSISPKNEEKVHVRVLTPHTGRECGAHERCFI